MPHFGEMAGAAGTLVPVVVSPGASPYAFIASEGGVMYLSGGTVSIVSLSRGGVAVTPGLLTGAFALRKSDSLTITYVVAPTMTWVPQ